MHQGAVMEGSWGSESVQVPDAAAALELLRAELSPGDVVLVKASNAAGLGSLAEALLAGSAVLFQAGLLDAVTQTVCWCIIFFFASAGASAAYLTVSEIFPVEVRAKAIAVFFAIAQTFGALGPWLYGLLIGTGQDHTRLFVGYLIGAAVMMIGGAVEVVLGVAAEGKSLEDVADPLSAVNGPGALSNVTGAPRPPAARATWH